MGPATSEKKPWSTAGTLPHHDADRRGRARRPISASLPRIFVREKHKLRRAPRDVEADGTRDPLELDRADLRVADSRAVGGVDDLLAHEHLALAGVIGDPGGDVDGPTEVVALLEQ